MLFSGFYFVLTFIGLTAVAQNRVNRESIESMKVAFITNRLNLSPQEAQVFWPVFNRFENELEGLRKKRRNERSVLMENFQGATDAEIERLVDGEIIFRQQELDILKKYHSEFKKILPIKKVALLYKAEEDYKKELLQQIKDRGARGRN